MVSFILTLCVLLAMNDNMTANAGYGKLRKLIQECEGKIKKLLRECCFDIQCFTPDTCAPVPSGRDYCRCIKANDSFYH